MMLAPFVALLAVTKPLAFPPEPIQSELTRGAGIYYDQKGVERVFQEDRAAIGRWYDGNVKRDTDEVIWLSPSLISRWLGYLNAREKWSIEELHARWHKLANVLDGHLTFVVELYALPKESFLDLTNEEPSKPETATKTRFLITWPSKDELDEQQHSEIHYRKKIAIDRRLDRLEPEVAPLALFKSYDLDGVNRWPWYTLDPIFEPLTPEFSERKPGTYDAIVGDYIRAIYFVQVPIADKAMQARQLQVRVFVPGKEPVACFDLKRSGK